MGALVEYAYVAFALISLLNKTFLIEAGPGKTTVLAAIEERLVLGAAI
jgi:hypothetical protein